MLVVPDRSIGGETKRALLVPSFRVQKQALRCVPAGAPRGMGLE